MPPPAVMKLEQSLSVEAPVDAVWSALVDVQRVAPCLPRAEITEVGDDGSYSGSFTVKLGPTTAAYRGTLKHQGLLAPPLGPVGADRRLVRGRR